MPSEQNKNKGNDKKQTDGKFASKKIKHDASAESARAKEGLTAPASDGERHVGNSTR